MLTKIHIHVLRRVKDSLCSNVACQVWKNDAIKSRSFSSVEGYGEVNKYIPRRAVLYVPGSDSRKLDKIPHVSADCIVMDCEDGVAASMKEVARETIKKYLIEKPEYFLKKDCSVRVNGIDSGMCADDLKCILSSTKLPQTIHIPKVENTDHIDWFSDQLCSLLNGRDISAKLRLIIFVESAHSLLNLYGICKHAISLSQDSKFLLDGIVFGSDDYCADIGATRTTQANEVFYARQHVVTVAKALRLQAIDLVHIDYKDIEGLQRQSLEGAQFGFTGKQVIHPSQIDVVQTSFTPSAQKVEWAKGLVDAFEEHQKQGKGAFTYKGSMIDRPLLLQARNILQTATSA